MSIKVTSRFIEECRDVKAFLKSKDGGMTWQDITPMINYFKGLGGLRVLCIAKINPGAIYEDEWFSRKSIDDPWESCNVEDLRDKDLLPDHEQHQVMDRLTSNNDMILIDIVYPDTGEEGQAYLDPKTGQIYTGFVPHPYGTTYRRSD